MSEPVAEELMIVDDPSIDVKVEEVVQEVLNEVEDVKEEKPTIPTIQPVVNFTEENARKFGIVYISMRNQWNAKFTTAEVDKYTITKTSIGYYNTMAEAIDAKNAALAEIANKIIAANAAKKLKTKKKTVKIVTTNVPSSNNNNAITAKENEIIMNIDNTLATIRSDDIVGISKNYKGDTWRMNFSKTELDVYGIVKAHIGMHISYLFHFKCSIHVRY